MDTSRSGGHTEAPACLRLAVARFPAAARTRASSPARYAPPRRHPRRRSVHVLRVACALKRFSASAQDGANLSTWVPTACAHGQLRSLQVTAVTDTHCGNRRGRHCIRADGRLVQENFGHCRDAQKVIADPSEASASSSPAYTITLARAAARLRSYAGVSCSRATWRTSVDPACSWRLATPKQATSNCSTHTQLCTPRTRRARQCKLCGADPVRRGRRRGPSRPSTRRP